MNVESFSDFELQMMRFRFKSVIRLAKYFEGDVSDNNNYIINVTVAPISFVKQLSVGELSFLIVKFGYKRLASMFGVSESFLRSLGKKALELKNTKLVPVEIFNSLSDKVVLDLAIRVPYIEILSAISFWSKSKLKRICSFNKLLINSNLTTSKGRRGELWFKSLRGDKIVVDANIEDSRSEFDFYDKEYSKVDVKSSRARLSKTKGDRWYFSIKSKIKSVNVDYFALVAFCELFVNPKRVLMIKKEDAETMSNNGSIVLTEEMLRSNKFKLKEIWSDGKS